MLLPCAHQSGRGRCLVWGWGAGPCSGSAQPGSASWWCPAEKSENPWPKKRPRPVLPGKFWEFRVNERAAEHMSKTKRFIRKDLPCGRPSWCWGCPTCSAAWPGSAGSGWYQVLLLLLHEPAAWTLPDPAGNCTALHVESPGLGAPADSESTNRRWWKGELHRV